MSPSRTNKFTIKFKELSTLNTKNCNKDTIDMINMYDIDIKHR
ncbi:hypothetical protein [Candidatus Arthromitus sp. SFB-mouse-NL]|nr:hypothetical protein [Candidatus Arthromitus sp. SFB-mouse-NL]